jgi:hypothetical protein
MQQPPVGLNTTENLLQIDNGYRSPFLAFKESAQTLFLRIHFELHCFKIPLWISCSKNRGKVGRTREMVNKILATIAIPLGHPLP